MPLTAVSLLSVADTSNVAAFGGAPSRTPGANTLLLVGVNCSDTAGTPVEPTSVVGAGITFSLITSSQTYDPVTAGSQLHNLSAWRGMSASPDGSRFTVTLPNNGTGCAFNVIEVSGVSTAGTNGASAVSQSISSRGGSASAQRVVLPSAGSTANGYVTFWGRGTQTLDGSANSTYDILDRCAYATPSTGLQSAFTALASQSSVNWTSGSAAQEAVILIEVVGDNPADAGAVISPYYASYYYPRVVNA